MLIYDIIIAYIMVHYMCSEHWDFCLSISAHVLFTLSLICG